MHNNIQVFVKYNEKTTTYLINNKISIFDFKTIVSKKINVPMSYFYMIYGNKILNSEKLTINISDDYNIIKYSTIMVRIRAHDGGDIVMRR